MGLAIAQINLDILSELLGLKGQADIQTILPAGWNDLSRRTCSLLVESQVFPPAAHGMALPQVTLVYETRAEGPRFKGIEFTEPKEKGHSLRPPDGEDEDDGDLSFVPWPPQGPEN